MTGLVEVELIETSESECYRKGLSCFICQISEGDRLARVF